VISTQEINTILIKKQSSLKESARENSERRTIPPGARGIFVKVRK